MSFESPAASNMQAPESRIAATGVPFPAEAAEDPGRVSAARQGEQHPRAQIHIGVHARERRAQHHEVHDSRRMTYPRMREEPHERTLGTSVAPVCVQGTTVTTMVSESM